jgi:release factor glutamine methyltransferase
MTARELLEDAARLAGHIGSDATAWDARILLAHVLRHSNPLAISPREELNAQAATRFGELWAQRLSGTPVQHLIGEWDFYGRTFHVDDRALIPRPETEVVISAALREAPDARRILDAGTGCGIIAITWLLEKPASRGIALDVSVEALALARENTRRHNLLSRLDVVASDWFSAVEGPPFDLIMANPPYLTLSGAADLSRTVREHEPERALFSGEDGLAAIRHLLDKIPRHLAAGAPFLFEFGYGQDELVKLEIRRRPEWVFVSVEPDMAGIPRVAVARRRGGATF